jgi:hypothetical protein
MKHAECTNGMIVRDTRDGAVYKVIGQRGVAPDGTATATDRGAWVEQTEEGPDGVKEVWVIHWSHLEQVTD